MEDVDYKKICEEQRQKINSYEQNGGAKLFYALQRKMNEMADMLNSNSLKSINLDDPKDKSFDRIFKLLEKSETVANSARVLGETAGITNDEVKDTTSPTFRRITTPESIADHVGELAGKNKD